MTTHNRIDFSATGDPKKILSHLFALTGELILLKNIRYKFEKNINIVSIGEDPFQDAIEKFLEYYKLKINRSAKSQPCIGIIDISNELRMPLKIGDIKKGFSDTHVTFRNHELVGVLEYFSDMYQIEFQKFPEFLLDTKISKEFIDLPITTNLNDVVFYLNENGITCESSEKNVLFISPKI